MSTVLGHLEAARAHTADARRAVQDAADLANGHVLGGAMAFALADLEEARRRIDRFISHARALPNTPPERAIH